MLQKSFYLDSCIWLNLFKKEGDSTKGKPYWEIAEELIKNVMFSEDKEIIYSKSILREIKSKLRDTLFKEKLFFMENEIKFKPIKMAESDYQFARKLESEFKYRLSFYDCLHIAICERLQLILVTRDNDLIKLARNYVIAEKPEKLI